MKRTESLWAYWVVMATLGPPTISGAHCALRDRPELREMYERRAGRVPSQLTMSRFLWRIAENEANVRAWLLDEANIDTARLVTPERRLLADAADAGIMILEHHRDMVMNEEAVDDRMMEKVIATREFIGENGETREQTGRLAAIRNRVFNHQPLGQGVERGLAELAGRILGEPGQMQQTQPAGSGT